MSRAAWHALVAVVLVTGCGGSGTHPAATSHPNAGAVQSAGRVRATVMLVGDSNMSFALSALGFALTEHDPAYEIIDVARAGTGIRSPDCPGLVSTCPTDDYWRVRLADALAHGSPDGFVVNLGVNDTAAPGEATGAGYADYGAKIDWLMRLLPASKPVWWTNLPCDIEPKARVAGCAAVDSALQAATRRWPSLTVLDWSAAANPHPKWLLSNLGGVHLSAEGGLAWAKLIEQALDARFPS